jgi:autotransporter-associated beta strand protein
MQAFDSYRWLSPVLVLALAAAAQAAAFTWDGDTDTDFGTNTNYVGDPVAPGNAPGANDTFTFAGNTRTAIVVDDTGTSWQGIQSFDFTGATAAFSFTAAAPGDDFEFDNVANTITNPVAFNHVFNNNITTGNVSFGVTQNNAGGGLTFNGDLTLNSDLTLTATAGPIAVNGAITGGQAVNIGGAGTVTLAGTNTFTGALTISGTATATVTGTLADTVDVDVQNTATFDVQATDSIDSLTTAAGAGVSIANGTTLTVGANNGASNIAGVVSGAGGLTVSGTNTATLAGANTFTGDFTVADTATATMTGTLADTVRVNISGTGTYDVQAADTIAELDAAAGSTVDLNSVELTISGATTSTVAGDVTGTDVSNGELTVAGGATVNLSGTNDYGGTTTIGAASTVDILAAAALSANTNFALNGGTLENSSAGLDIANGIALGAPGSTFTADAATTISGAITGGTDLTVNGDSAVTLTNGGNTLTNLAIGGTATVVAQHVDALGSGDLTLNVGTTLNLDTAATPDFDNDIDVAGNSTLTVTQDAQASGLLTGANTLTRNGAGALELSGASVGFTGTLDLDAGTTDISGTVGAVASTVNVNNGATLIGGGTVGGALNVNNGGTINAGNSPGQINVGGDFTVAAGGTLVFEVDPSVANYLTSPGTGHDQYVVTGATDISATANVQVTFNPTAAANGTYVVDNDTFVGVDGTGVPTINLGGQTVTDNVDMVTYALAEDLVGNNINVVANRIEYDQLLVPGIMTANEVAVANGLDALGASAPAGDEVTLLLAIDALGQAIIDSAGAAADIANYRSAFSNLSPERYDAIDRANRRSTQMMVDVQYDYLNIRRMGNPGYAIAVANGDFHRNLASMLADTSGQTDGMAEPIETSDFYAPEQSMGGFARAFGAQVQSDATSTRTGYESDVYGGEVGLDWNIDSNLLIGVSVGYVRNDLDFDANTGEAETDTIRGGLYMSWVPAEEWFVDGSFSYGYHMNEAERRIVVVGLAPRTAKGDYDAHDITIAGRVGLDLAPGEDVTLTPYAGAQYTLFMQEAFTETGAGAMNLAIDDQTTNSLQSQLGVRMAVVFRGENVTLVPEATLGWQHEFLADDENINARFSGANGGFVINRGSPERDAIIYGAGVSALMGDEGNMNLYLRYQGQNWADTDIHAISGGLTLRF